MEYRTLSIFFLAAIAAGAFLGAATKHALDPVLVALIAVFLGFLTFLTWFFLRPVTWVFGASLAAVAALYAADLLFLGG